jgi:hypothetical protein
MVMDNTPIEWTWDATSRTWTGRGINLVATVSSTGHRSGWIVTVAEPGEPPSTLTTQAITAWAGKKIVENYTKELF